MWQIISPNSSGNSEPIELKRLKYQLANNSCKCKICIDREKITLVSTPQESKETQIKETHPSLVRITNKFTDGLLGQGRPENVFCPGCYMALNLFQKKDIRVLKDEESETNSEMFSCDKSTEKNVPYLEKATCMADIFIPKYSNVTFSDTMTEYSNDISVYALSRKQRNLVSFSDNQNENRNEPSFFGNCLCMENFINSIRPPLVDCDI